MATKKDQLVIHPADEAYPRDPPEDPVPTPTLTCPPLPGQQAAGDPVRVLLTGDNRDAITEAYIPAEEFDFRINVNGQFFEHVADAADSGTWIFAPTR